MPLNMDFHGCNCKNVTITEGIFGEVWIGKLIDIIFILLHNIKCIKYI